MIEKHMEKIEQEEFESEDGVIEEPESEEELEKEEMAIAAEFEEECVGDGGKQSPDQRYAQTLNATAHGAKGLSGYINEIGKYGNLTPEEESVLGKAASAGDAAAREKLVNHNLRLVVNIAKKFAGHGVDMDDLVAYGNLGLMEAVDRFDPMKGFKLTTYATYWIRMEITRGIQKMKNAITKPDHVIAAMSYVNKTFNALQGVLMRDPSAKEISLAINGKFSEGQVEAIRSLMLNGAAVSLDKKLDSQDAESDTLETVIADEATETPLDYALRVDREQILADAVKELKPQFQTVIKMKYGIGTDSGSDAKLYTLDEIAERLEAEGFTNKEGGRYTKEYVRQLEGNALKALKQNPKVAALGSIA